MRAAAILGLGCSPNSLKPFQDAAVNVSSRGNAELRSAGQPGAAVPTCEWRVGLPASPEEADVVLLFGGDGTIHRHLNQLVKLALPVLIAPAGSGNDFARALGLSSWRDAGAAWRRYCEKQDNVRVIDLGVITPLGGKSGEAPRYFCSVAGIGLDSEVARRAHDLPRWLRGHGGYALTLVPTVFRYAPFPMKILARDEAGTWTRRSDQPTVLAAFANTSTYGDGMKIAPHARLDDGELDVCVIAGIDPFKLFCLFPTVYFGRHLRISGVNYFRASRLRVETEMPLDVYGDGEYVCQTAIEVGVARAALKVITA